jgi:hypothetical protein
MQRGGAVPTAITLKLTLILLLLLQAATVSRGTGENVVGSQVRRSPPRTPQ